MRKKLILLLLLILMLKTSTSFKVVAYEAESESYKIEWGNLNDFSEKKGSENYDLVDTGGQLGAGESESDNYVIYSGFEYFYSLIDFTFTISNNEIDFGTLSPGSPEQDTTNVTVTSGAAHGYQVTTEENNQLENQGYRGVYILDTEGDNSDITYSNNGDWLLATTYGFGYSLANITGTDAEFTTGYKQFADMDNSEDPQVIMSKSGVTRESEIQTT